MGGEGRDVHGVLIPAVCVARASRRWPGNVAALAGASARSCFSSWQEEEDSRAPGGLGLHGRQVRVFHFFLFLFLF